MSYYLAHKMAQSTIDNNDISANMIGINPEETDIDVVVELLNLLNVHTLLRREELIEKLIKKTGKSRRTVERRLKEAIRDKIVLKLQKKDLENYGYEAPKKNAVFIASKEILNTRRNLDSIFALFESNDLSDLNFGALELRNFQVSHSAGNYLFSKKEYATLLALIERIANNKNIADPEFVNNLFMVINNEMHIRRKRIFKDRKFLEAVRRILSFYPAHEYYLKPNNPIANLINLLGIYRDYGVIERLKEDAEKSDSQLFRQLTTLYVQKTTTKVILDNEIEIRKLRHELQKKGKVEIVEALNNLSIVASSNMNMISKEYEAYLLE